VATPRVFDQRDENIQHHGRPQISPGLGDQDNRDSFGAGVRSFTQAELTQDVFVGCLLASEGSAVRG